MGVRVKHKSLGIRCGRESLARYWCAVAAPADVAIRGLICSTVADRQCQRGSRVPRRSARQNQPTPSQFRNGVKCDQPLDGARQVVACSVRNRRHRTSGKVSTSAERSAPPGTAAHHSTRQDTYVFDAHAPRGWPSPRAQILPPPAPFPVRLRPRANTRPIWVVPLSLNTGRRSR